MKKRLGKIRISDRFLEDWKDFNLIKDVLSKFTSSFNWTRNFFSPGLGLEIIVTGECPYFDEVEEGEPIPEYHILCQKIYYNWTTYDGKAKGVKWMFWPVGWE